MVLKHKKPSLADKISDIISAVPKVVDSDDDVDGTAAQVLDNFDESDSEVELSSTIRKKNVTFLDETDERYKGKKVSRKDIYDDSDNDSDGESVSNLSGPDNSEPEDDESEREGGEDDESDDDGGGDGSDSEEPFSDDNDEDEVDDANPLYRNRQESSITTMTPSNPRGDIEKGNCVRQQLSLWENLLEMRIQMQKCLIASNKMPQFDVYKNYSSDKTFAKTSSETKSKLAGLLDRLLEIQDKLLKKNPETKKLFTNKQDSQTELEKVDPMDEEICSDTEDEMEENGEVDDDDEDDQKSEEPPNKKKRKTLDQYEQILSDSHKKFTPYRNSVIQKWNDKTRIASGKMDKSTSQPVVKQIEFIMSDKSKIIRRTQLKRSEYDIVGKESKCDADEDERRAQEYDTEIYDDDDFYHQLLRELIEQKSADITDPVQLSKQWVQLQNLRNKMKKKVDTRATKGRRIRYNVHNKLVNFMAPITVNDTWSDLAKTELYNSLFGKIKAVENE